MIRSPAQKPTLDWVAVLVLSLASLGSGCASASSTRRSERLDLRLPLRVAVLPFYDAAAGDQGMAIPAAALLDVNPLLTDESLDKIHAPRVLRGKFVANLHRTELEVLSPLVVDHRVAIDGVLNKTPPLQARAAYARRVGQLLGAELVVFGTVTEWDRHYWILASWVSVGVQLELRDGRTGESLFWGDFRVLESSGLHKGMIASDPAQVLAVAMGETMHGLRNTIFATLSSEITREATQKVLGRPYQRHPEIRHFAGRYIGGELRLLALGTPGGQALVDLPGQGRVPLSESAPGVYTLSLAAKPPAGPTGTPLEVELVLQRRRARALTTVPSR